MFRWERYLLAQTTPPPNGQTPHSEPHHTLMKRLLGLMFAAAATFSIAAYTPPRVPPGCAPDNGGLKLNQVTSNDPALLTMVV